MKKIIAIILCAAMMLAVVGCAKTEEAAPADAKEVLTVAISPDFAPMEFVDTSKTGQEQFVGFDITLANYLADGLGMTLEIKPMSFDACQTAVQLGNVDMSISGFSWTAEREENFAISDYYIAGDNETEQVIISTKENAGKFTSPEDLAGKKVGAQIASLQEKLVTEELPESELVSFKDINDGVLALQTGKIDAMAVAKGNGDAIISNNPDVAGSGFKFDVDPKYENNVILLNKESTELLAKVNELLAQALEQDLYTGWYDEACELAEIDTAADLSYDASGNVAG